MKTDWSQGLSKAYAAEEQGKRISGVAQSVLGQISIGLELSSAASLLFSC